LFTGDASSDFLMEALFRGGFATKPTSRSLDDGLEMIGAFQTAAIRCVPPGNLPLPIEQRNCRPFLTSEVKLLPRVKAVLALGRIAFIGYLKSIDVPGFRASGHIFRHGGRYELGQQLPTLFASYHPSPRNTNTGRLTASGLSMVVSNIIHYLAQERRE
jgi:uracil-DNA glycosylase